MFDAVDTNDTRRIETTELGRAFVQYGYSKLSYHPSSFTGGFSV
jgi:hypothetical protein